MAWTAAGDALGAGYEFGPPLPDGTHVTMCGGGPFGWLPGEWTDDTSMAYVLAREVADPDGDLIALTTQNAVARAWGNWSRTAPDVGAHTHRVLSLAMAHPLWADQPAACLRSAAIEVHQASQWTGGNGCLMRTAPIGLAYPQDPHKTTVAATIYAGMTHADPDAIEACVLWSELIRLAVATGNLDPGRALRQVRLSRRATFRDLLADAHGADPATWTWSNGGAIDALRTAWAAITGNLGDPVAAVEAAVRAGGDTDTTAAIAGGLVGALHGLSALPESWAGSVHGWPNLRLPALPTVALP